MKRFKMKYSNKITVVLLFALSLGGFAFFGSGSAQAQTNDDGSIEYLDLRDVSMNEAVRLISEESGINLMATQEAMKTTVSLFVQNLTVDGAVEVLCKTHGLWYREDDSTGVIRIMTLEEYQKDLVV
ncbi:MAG: hypothetical protein KJ645_01535 [Planctomycetes bacterium]|nr:hypothetical protein [Planctomycetota bacterium]